LIIYLDECGYTGEDLLNSEQPIFTLATINFSETRCKELKYDFFKPVSASELKHKKIAKYPSQQNMAINFINLMKEHRDHVKLLSVHKEYSLVTLMVDILVETCAHKDGFDLYNQGANIAMSNLFYYCIPAFGGDAFFKSLLRNFQQMIRERSIESYNRFFRPLFEGTFSKDLEDILTFIKYPHVRLGFEFLEHLPESALDVVLSYALDLMAKWRNVTSDEINLFYDNSSSMTNQRIFWDALVDPNLKPAVVGYDIRTQKFPIAVHNTFFENSRDFVGLQLSDVLAGALARHGRWLIGGRDKHDEYGSKLNNIFSDMPIDLLLWPEPKVTPEELGTTGENAKNPIHHTLEIINKMKPQ
jgi:hypothetical protein